MADFDLQMPFALAGDQPRAVAELVAGLGRGDRYQTLLGVTGSGKTVTMANVIAARGRPTLILSHNKTLAAQLYGELKSFFPRNAVEYFVSYYDYYQPEAYVPQTDTYIEKDASINEDIDALRLRATSSLVEREDVVVVSSVSAIYGLGDPVQYRELMVTVDVGEERPRDGVLEELVQIQYRRNDVVLERGTFRVRGDTVEILPAYEEQAVRIEFWGDEVERISKIDPLTGNVIAELQRCAIYPATHYVTRRPTVDRAARASGWSHAPCSTSTCCSRSARAPGSRTTAGTWTGAVRVSVRPACWTTSPTTTSPSSTSRTSACRRSAGCTMAIARAS
jgi:excinuclease ABC subunit B